MFLSEKQSNLRFALHTAKQLKDLEGKIEMAQSLGLHRDALKLTRRLAALSQDLQETKAMLAIGHN